MLLSASNVSKAIRNSLEKIVSRNFEFEIADTHTQCKWPVAKSREITTFSVVATVSIQWKIHSVFSVSSENSYKLNEQQYERKRVVSTERKRFLPSYARVFVVCACSSGSSIIIINTQTWSFHPMETVCADMHQHKHIHTVRKRLLNLTCVGVGIFKPFRKLISTCSLVVKKSWIQCALTTYQAGWISFKYVQSSQLVSTDEINRC